MKTLIRFSVSLILAASAIVTTSTVFAQEGFDDEEVVIFLKKIRDDESNYLRDVTRATAKEISKSGEFLAKPYKKNAVGPTVSVESPRFSYEPFKDGMSAKELASAGLSIVSDIGSIFGRDKEAYEADKANARINNSRALDVWDNTQKMKVTMSSRVTLVDNSDDREISRTIKIDKVFDSKEEFLESKNSLIESAVVGEVKKVLVEYLEDDTGF